MFTVPPGCGWGQWRSCSPGVLDAQLRADSDLTHFEYFTLAMLSEAPGRTLRMTELAGRANATLSRLSHVVGRLEKRGFVRRKPCADDRRATIASLTSSGWEKVQQSAPGHVEAVQHNVIRALTPERIDQLTEIGEAILDRVDPDRRMNRD